jgi:1-acyl-sn-glycerol-3-phosphate acyltransferase
MRVLDFDADGAAILRGATGTLVIANHPSLLDIVLIMSLMERTQCVVKAGAWKNPFMRGVIKATNYIPNLGDPGQVIDNCVAALKSGNNLVIFPEGSRTVPGQKVRLQRGFANIAIRAGAPIRLVTVTCTPPMLRKGEKWYQCPVSRPRYRVRVCDLVDTDRFALAEIPSRAARSLTAHVARRFEELTAYGPA